MLFCIFRRGEQVDGRVSPLMEALVKDLTVEFQLMDLLMHPAEQIQSHSPFPENALPTD